VGLYGGDGNDMWGQICLREKLWHTQSRHSTLPTWQLGVPICGRLRSRRNESSCGRIFALPTELLDVQ